MSLNEDREVLGKEWSAVSNVENSLAAIRTEQQVCDWSSSVEQFQWNLYDRDKCQVVENWSEWLWESGSSKYRYSFQKAYRGIGS